MPPKVAMSKILPLPRALLRTESAVERVATRRGAAAFLDRLLSVSVSEKPAPSPRFYADSLINPPA